jgi:hypothetical protein
MLKVRIDGKLVSLPGLWKGILAYAEKVGGILRVRVFENQQDNVLVVFADDNCAWLTWDADQADQCLVKIGFSPVYFGIAGVYYAAGGS